MRLVESIKCGKVKATLILQKINSYNRDNGVTKGLKEIGRVLKTKYILDYYTKKELRKEVQKILNKGEAINSVGRLMFFGKHGRLNKLALENQLEKVYNTIKDEEWFELEEFKRVGPLGNQHVNFLDKYI